MTVSPRWRFGLASRGCKRVLPPRSSRPSPRQVPPQGQGRLPRLLRREHHLAHRQPRRPRRHRPRPPSARWTPPMTNAGSDVSAVAFRTNSSPARIPELLRARRERRPHPEVAGPVQHRPPHPWSRSCVLTPTSASGPSTRRASRTGRSSCPRWTPSASASRATSARSLTTNSTPASRVQRPHLPGPLQQFAVAQVLLAQLDHVRPALDCLAHRPLQRAGRTAGRSPAPAGGRWPAAAGRRAQHQGPAPGC